MDEISEAIMSTSNPEKLDNLWNQYIIELNKIIFKPEVVEGMNKAFKILKDSFDLYRNNCIQDNTNKFDLKDLLFSFVTMKQMIEMNNI